jgi:hypothetical protein
MKLLETGGVGRFMGTIPKNISVSEKAIGDVVENIHFKLKKSLATGDSGTLLTKLTYS